MSGQKYSQKPLKETFGNDDFLGGYDETGSKRYNKAAIIDAAGGGGGQVDSVTGTADEIVVSGTAVDPVLSLAAAVISSLGLADTATQPAVLAAAIINFITEAQVIDTARNFTKGQGTAPIALSIVGGNVTPDLATGNAFTLDVSANFTLQLPTNDRTTSWHIRCTVTGVGGYTTTTVAGYVADGGGTVTLPTVTADKYTLFCQSYGDGTHSIAIHTDQP